MPQQKKSEQEDLKALLQDIFHVDSKALGTLTKNLAIRTAPLMHRHQIMRCFTESL